MTLEKPPTTLGENQFESSSLFIARILRQNCTTGERHRNRGRGTPQKLRKRDSSKGTNFDAGLGMNFEVVVLLKSVQSVQLVQQVLCMFFEAGHTTFNVVLLLQIFLFWLFADWHDFRGGFQA